MVRAILRSDGWRVRKSVLVEAMGQDAYLKLRKTFKMSTRLPVVNKIKTMTLVGTERSRTSKGEPCANLVVPRFMGAMWIKLGHIRPCRLTLPEGIAVEFSVFSASLRHEQQVVLDYLLSEIYTDENEAIGAAGAICEMQAGYGKTYLAMGVIRSLGCKTLVVVPNSVLLNQWMEALSGVFPNNTVGQYSSRAKQDGDVVVMVINSVLTDEFTFKQGRGRGAVKTQYEWREYLDQFGLVIWDEVHMYCTTQRVEALRRASSRYSLGITAEANNRPDKFDRAAHSWVGPVIVCDKLEGFDDGSDPIHFTAHVERVGYLGPDEFTQRIINPSTEMVQASAMTKQFLQDPWRTASIITDAHRLYEAGHNVFIFGDSRAFVKVIRDILVAEGTVVDAPEEGGVSQNGVSALMGGMRGHEINTASSAQVLVCTFQFACVGLSLPAFDAMILGTPRKAQTYQTVKRIFRLSGDPSITRIIIDYVDERTPMKGQYSKRRQVYQSDEISAEITKREMLWSDVALDDEKKTLYQKIIAKYV
jgi:hypothetical protein